MRSVERGIYPIASLAVALTILKFSYNIYYNNQ